MAVVGGTLSLATQRHMLEEKIKLCKWSPRQLREKISHYPPLSAFTLWRSELGHSGNGEICLSPTSLHPHCWWALSAPIIISPVDLGMCMVDPEALSDITSTKEG